MGRVELAGLLQHTYRWMRAGSEINPAVTQAAPALTAAVQLYDAELYGPALGQLRAVVALLHRIREASPALPPL